MIIKKDKNKNDYSLVGGGFWIRDFTKKFTKPADINHLISVKDIPLLLENEIANQKKMYQRVESENFTHEKIVICGSGFGFNEKSNLMDSIPGDVTIITVNDALREWKNNRRIDYYVINNPYRECLNYFPRQIRFWPRCIASSRTNSQFLEAYHQAYIYIYSPVSEKGYTCLGIKEASWLIDDYRNPICAAVVLAYKFGAKKVLLFTCDDAFKEHRPGTEKVTENLWVYPQQKQAHNLIDGNLYWLTKAGIKVGCFGEGLLYENATYIHEKELNEFFTN